MAYSKEKKIVDVKKYFLFMIGTWLPMGVMVQE